MSAMGRCTCGGALHMAEGGSVDDEDLTKPSFRKPLIAKRREDRQDREGAKDAPLSMMIVVSLLDHWECPEISRLWHVGQLTKLVPM